MLLEKGKRYRLTTLSHEGWSDGQKHPELDCVWDFFDDDGVYLGEAWGLEPRFTEWPESALMGDNFIFIGKLGRADVVIDEIVQVRCNRQEG